jgi:hypothetical protein
MNNTNDETKDKASSIIENFSRAEKAKRDAEILDKMNEIADYAAKIKCTHKVNEKNPNFVDFFLGAEYKGCCPVLPETFLNFIDSTIKGGFREGIGYSLSQILEMIQKDRENESK